MQSEPRLSAPLPEAPSRDQGGHQHRTAESGWPHGRHGWLQHDVPCRRRQYRDYGIPLAGLPDSQWPFGSVLRPGLRPLFSDKQYQYSYKPALVGHSPGPAMLAEPSQSLHPGALAGGELYYNLLGQTVRHLPAAALHDTPLPRAGGGSG